MSEPMMTGIGVRPAEPSDLAAVAAIYAHFVHTSTATFDDQEPPLSYWQGKLDSDAPGDHFLVAYRGVAPGAQAGRPMASDTDRILGYAYSGAYRARPAYRLTRESSVYISPELTGKGLGARL